jgi:hypothetical protein
MPSDRSGLIRPLPLLIMPNRPTSTSRRVRAQHHIRASAIHRTNCCIRATNRMRFGSRIKNLYINTNDHPTLSSYPYRAYPNLPPAVTFAHSCPPLLDEPAPVQLNSPALTSNQSRTLHMMYHECKRIQEASRSLSNGGNVLEDAFDASYLGKQATPIPIIADRIALPPHAGTIDITTVLPHDLLTIKRVIMIASNMIIIGDTPPLCINGIFAVPKCPANSCMIKPPWFALPTPDILDPLTHSLLLNVTYLIIIICWLTPCNVD